MAEEEFLPDDADGQNKRIWPFSNEADAKRAADLFASLKTPAAQKKRLQERIMISYEYLPMIAPIIMEAIHRAEIATRHDFLDLFLRSVRGGKDLSLIADSLARMMSDPNFALREKAANLLIEMGTAANGAAVRAVGLLRSKMTDVQVNTLRLLGAVGPICAKIALPKIETMLKGNLDREVVSEARLTMKILRGEALPEEASRSRPAADDKQVSAEFPNIAGKIILVADDEEGIRRMICNALIGFGARVIEAKNGREALDKMLETEKVDLLLMDLLMPQMNGAEMLRALREDKRFDNLPVYVVSARTERSLLMAMAKLGVAGYFMKPFKLRDILTRLNETFTA